MLLISILAVVLALVVLLGTTPVFVSGSLTKVKFTPSSPGSGSIQEIFVTDHSWAEMIDAIDVTHTGSGGIQALLAGVLRGDGNVKAFYDSANPFYKTPVFIKVGQKGLFQFFIDGTVFYSIPAMIKKVNSQAPVNGGVAYDFDISIDSTAGAYTYPV